MKPIGFSTGALAKGDYRRGIELQAHNPRLRAIELSALREHELPSLSSNADKLDLSHFSYVSFHAPSKLVACDEKLVFESLLTIPNRWPIIVHPELLKTRELWRSLGSRLCLENMDNRKTGGRTVREVHDLFHAFPEATFCLDLAHARQIDPTMATAIRMLREFGTRLRQLHVSEVGPRGEHRSLSVLAIYAFELIVDLVPEDCPIIIESVIPPEEIEAEIDKTFAVFSKRKSETRKSVASSRRPLHE
jgi:hypothetical protein